MVVCLLASRDAVAFNTLICFPNLSASEMLQKWPTDGNAAPNQHGFNPPTPGI